MASLRGIAQLALAFGCVFLVVLGLYYSLGPAGERVLLERPGSAARLGSDSSTATAFFEVDGDMVELTMLFSEAEDPTSVLRTRVRLSDGQSHSVIVGEREDAGGPHRYTFRRIGYTVEMRLAPVQTINASFIIPD
ncbi:MAG: hypothetical protein AB8B85_04270 [Paracoccaceae bacterium]